MSESFRPHSAPTNIQNQEHHKCYVSKSAALARAIDDKKDRKGKSGQDERWGCLNGVDAEPRQVGNGEEHRSTNPEVWGDGNAAAPAATDEVCE